MAVMLFGLLFAGPTVCVAIKLLPWRITTFEEFSDFFEQQFRLRFLTVAVSFIVASAIGVVYLAISLLETPLFF